MNISERFYLFFSAILAVYGLKQRNPQGNKLRILVNIDEVRKLLGWKRKTIQNILDYHQDNRIDKPLEFHSTPFRRYYKIKNVPNPHSYGLVRIKFIPSDYVRWTDENKLKLILDVHDSLLSTTERRIK